MVTVRTVVAMSVPVFWKLAKSCVPCRCAAAASMASRASGASGPVAQTKGASRGGTQRRVGHRR